MAWWNIPGAELTPPVTRDRVAAWFDSQDYKYDLDDNGRTVLSGFGGNPFVVDVANDDIMAVYGRLWTNLPPSDETLDSLRALLCRLNDNRTLPTLHTLTDDDGVQVGAKITVSISKGFNDSQLADILGTSLHAVMSTFEEIAEELGLSADDDNDA